MGRKRSNFHIIARKDRAAFLNTIADEIEKRAEAITQIGCAETGLPEVRLNGERGRTTGQLRLFAAHILQGGYLDQRHEKALPERQPLPRPDLRLMQRPIAIAYQGGQKRVATTHGVREILTSMCDQRQASPALYETTAQNWPTASRPV